jgi:hypothetical protein
MIETLGLAGAGSRTPKLRLQEPPGIGAPEHK